MRLSQYIDRQPKKRRKSRSASSGMVSNVAKHGSFVSMLTIWGAALLGLSVLVLPASAIARMSMITGAGTLFGFAQFAFAAVAALFGGAIAFIAARGIRNHAMRDTVGNAIVSVVQSRNIEPIDPSSELGSASLDEPIEAEESHAETSAEFEEVPEGEAASVQADAQPIPGEPVERGNKLGAPQEETPETPEEPLIKRKHFQTALIEECEDATCEAAESPKASQPERETEQVSEPAAMTASIITTKPRQGGSNRKVGTPMGGSAWSLTQFDPGIKPPPPAAPPLPESITKELEEPAPEIAPESAPEPESAPKHAEPLADTPRSLDLAEFAELPGRNAVWVEEPAPQEDSKPVSESEPVSAITDAPLAAQAPSISALEKLRQTPTEELSLVQMVERFAGALHEHQEAERKRQPGTGPKRDAALATALKALDLFSESGFDMGGESLPAQANDKLGETESELREALAKLQSLSGAA